MKKLCAFLAVVLSLVFAGATLAQDKPAATPDKPAAEAAKPAAPEPAASKSAASMALSAAKAPVLSWKDDYATRHLHLGEPP